MTASAAWLRALERTAPIAANPAFVFPDVVQDLASTLGDAPALLSAREAVSYRDLAARANRYARWALDHGIAKGDAVGLLMPNRPEYMAVWLGITSVGGVVALLNTNLRGRALAHCIDLASPRHIIVDAALLDAMHSAQPHCLSAAAIWTLAPGHDPFVRYADTLLSTSERRAVTIEDPALYIYTSGTTGLPKAANVSHFRVMQWSHWFAGMMDVTPADRMYNALPLYHSVGGVLAMGAMLAGGGSVVIPARFSASRFWDDVAAWDCTLFQYIGELCRYLLHAAPAEGEARHRIRLACGNGLRPDVWTEFKRRFRIPKILEFYAATEGNVSLFNVDEKPGAIGRIPPFLAHRFPAALVKFDVATEQPVRDENGRCVPCGHGEAGEALGKIGTGAGRFEGYTNRDASERKILRDVFAAGDAWFRTGDLMRRDSGGHFYFVDRIGDTFRWKGENVATTEVAEALCAFPGVKEANVYGVAVPHADGRAGMAAIVVEPGVDLAGLHAHLGERLPEYARPAFLRIRDELDVTATFKHTKGDFVRAGFDPAATDDALYFDDRQRGAFVVLDKPLFDRIQTGQIRVE